MSDMLRPAISVIFATGLLCLGTISMMEMSQSEVQEKNELYWDKAQKRALERAKEIEAQNIRDKQIEEEKQAIEKAKQKEAEEKKKKEEQERKAKEEAEAKKKAEEEQKRQQEQQQQYKEPAYQAGNVLSRSKGAIYGPSGKETYYNLPMEGVVSIMRGMGNNDKYWVRDDGVKMLGDYVMIAANLNIRPRGSHVETSLGMGIVCDTGGFAHNNPTQIDIATAW